MVPARRDSFSTSLTGAGRDMGSSRVLVPIRKSAHVFVWPARAGHRAPARYRPSLAAVLPIEGSGACRSRAPLLVSLRCGASRPLDVGPDAGSGVKADLPAHPGRASERSVAVDVQFITITARRAMSRKCHGELDGNSRGPTNDPTWRLSTTSIRTPSSTVWSASPTSSAGARPRGLSARARPPR
jgi:hypothetical protein